MTTDGHLPMTPALCDSCQRFTEDETCAAFPGGIPEDILWDGADHRVSRPGDRGVVYLPDPGKQELFDNWALCWHRT